MEEKKIDHRDREQWEACRKLRVKGYNGCVLAGTGFGKTRVMVKSIIGWCEQEMIGDAILILVPFEHLKTRFKDEFCKVMGEEKGKEFVENHVEMYCYASISKLDPIAFSLVVCDEIHLGLTDKCMEFYAMFKGPKMMCTATMPEDSEYRKRLINLVPLAYKITIDRCVELGIVAPYKIKCVALELTKEEKAEYKTVNANFGYWKGKLGFDAFNMAQAVLANKSKYGNEMMQAALGFYRAIRQRKTIVDHAKNKIKLAQLFANSTDGRILVFGGDNAFTDSLADSITGSVIYHSKKTKKVREAALKAFKNGEAKVLCSTKALNQGLDIPNASIGLICGLTSKALTMIQRVGRLVRIDPDDPKKIGSIVILYVKDSQEEKWLINSLKTTDPSNIVWTNQQELLESA
mgnify:CR=1 FL=1